jgi:hypothetical protein
MESLFTQIAPVLEQMGPGSNLAPLAAGTSTAPTAQPISVSSLQKTASSKAHSDSGSSSSPRDSVHSIKIEDDISESFGQLALDEHGHLRWIGGSSTMSLIQSFRALTTSPLHRVSPMDDNPLAPGPSANKLYFPASVYFGKVHALPGPEEVEYPERDLADKLVSICSI